MDDPSELPAELKAYMSMEWTKLKRFFADDVQADWARFLVEAAKPTTFKFWMYGANFQLMGDDLSTPTSSGEPDGAEEP